MKKQKKKFLVKKISTIALIMIMIVNLVLLGARKIDPLLFWLIIAICAIIAFRAFPTKKQKKRKARKKKPKHRR